LQEDNEIELTSSDIKLYPADFVITFDITWNGIPFDEFLSLNVSLFNQNG